MKKLLKILTCFTMMISMFGCSNNNEKGNNSTSNTISYETTSTNLLNNLDRLNNDAEIVASFVVLVWQEVGPDDTMKYLKYLYDSNFPYNYVKDDLKEAFDIKWPAGDEELEKYATKYKNSYDSVVKLQSTCKTQIKDLKSAVTSDNENNYDAIEEYYLKSDSFGDFALAPSGNRLNYQSNMQSYLNDLSSLRKKVDIS